MKAEDLLIEAYPGRRSGGQHVGIIGTGIRITHLPTSTIAACDMHRSQSKNKDAAMEMIEWALLNAGWRD